MTNFTKEQFNEAVYNYIKATFEDTALPTINDEDLIVAQESIDIITDLSQMLNVDLKQILNFA